MTDPNDVPLPELFALLVDAGALRALLRLARDEDLGEVGDVTSLSIIEAGRRGTGDAAPREDGVLCGLAVVPVLLEVFDADLEPATFAADGDACVAGRAIATLSGSLRDLLAVERTALNLLGRLSGIATATRRAVDAVAETGAAITDTRKTTPGWRGLEKYAVRCGGGRVHRLGLSDAALYKDNHLAGIAPGDLAEAVRRAVADARDRADLRFVEVEVDDLDQLERLLPLAPEPVGVVLLDNFAPADLRRAVAVRDARAPGLVLEASGGVTPETARAVAETGVDRIAIGAITHSAAALDLGLDLVAGAGR